MEMVENHNDLHDIHYEEINNEGLNALETLHSSPGILGSTVIQYFHELYSDK